MNSEESTFPLMDDTDDRKVTSEISANPVSSNGCIAIPVATEKN